MGEALTLRGQLVGHEGWVTAIATTAENPNMILSASRDKTLIVWALTHDGENLGFPRYALRGHHHIVSDVALSSDGQFALSSSWDNTLRLWDLNTGQTIRRFVGHTKDVLSVAFSPSNRQIVSCGRDKTMRVWNTLGECKYTIANTSDEDTVQHTEWISCVRFSPNEKKTTVVSAGWDKLVKVWNLQDCTLQTNLVGHDGYLNSVTISPDGSLCASGGKEGTAVLFDLHERKVLYKLNAGDIIYQVAFSPNRYWLCAATGSSIKIWDLESKVTIADIKLDSEDDEHHGKRFTPPHCSCIAWSEDGSTLFAGYSDSVIRVYQVA